MMRKSSISRMVLPALIALLLLANPMSLLASTEGSDTIAKLKQMRLAQNEHTRIANIKATSIEVSKQNTEIPGLVFRKALKEKSSSQSPTLTSRSTPGIHRITPSYLNAGISTRSAAINPVMHGSGKLTFLDTDSNPDSMFFNFLTEMNGADTAGMDVGLGIGLGMIFGNPMDYSGAKAFGHDSSLVLLLHRPGDVGDGTTLPYLDYADVTAVPPIDDPTAPWFDMSSDSVGVDDIWVVYTRTSKLYTVLQVTSTSESWPDEHIAFDYMIQTDGSNVFVDTPPPDSVSITVNDLEADTVAVGDTLNITILLGADPGGILAVAWDQNHNGILDPIDILIEEYEFMDNDEHDLNPADSIFEFLFDDDMAEGINFIANDFLFAVHNTDGMDAASVHFYADSTDYYVSGTVRETTTGDPLEGIIVWGDYDQMMPPPPTREDDPDKDDMGPTAIAITDTAGHYTLFFPDPGNIIIGSWDHLMVTPGLIPEPQHQILELADTLENIDFAYRESHETIEGIVTDEFGGPLADIEVRAFRHDDMDGGGDYYGLTNAAGFYEIGVDLGFFWVEINGKDLIPDYMIPAPVEIEVMATGSNIVDFVLLEPNDFISGTVTLDGVPLDDEMVGAWNHMFGWNATVTDVAGDYSVAVYTPPVRDDGPMEMMGYDLHVDMYNLPPGVVQTSDNWNVAPGTIDEDIIFETVAGGIYGAFINSETGDTLRDAWDVGLNAQNIDTGMEFWVNSDMDGLYELYLADGIYEITAGGMDWYGPTSDTVIIAGSMDLYDVLLDPVQYNGVFEGRILDDFTNAPIEGAEIGIGNEFWGDSQITDASGFFHFDLPNGYYNFFVWAEDYLEYWGDVDIDNDYIVRDIFLQELLINGVIYGVVSDTSGAVDLPVVNAEVGIYDPRTQIGFYTWTDTSGEYWFDLPNGMYEIYVDHPEYLPYFDEGLLVSYDTTEYNPALSTADGAISGVVYDRETLEPIWDAGVWITDANSTDSTGFWITVDDTGYFHIPVMNGTYDVHVDAYEYEHYFLAGLIVTDRDVVLDIPLDRREFMGPQIFRIQDQPDDQGRWVRMEFGSNGDDYNHFSAYSIWRIGHTPMGEIWDFIAYLPDVGMPMYSLVAPTLIDSNATNTEPSDFLSEFIVTGHYDSWNFVPGGPTFGYSFDNIAPGAPVGLTLVAAGGTYNEMLWEPSTDSDFQNFAVYRSDSDDFTDLEPTALVTESTYRDDAVAEGQDFYYMVKTVDANGNESEGSGTLSFVAIDGENLTPTEFSLSQNYPNPFNPSTTISFGLPEASHVTLEIFNVLGQKVRTLTDSNVSAGYFNIIWNGLDQSGKELGSGTYIYRLQTADMTVAKKMVLMK